MARQKVLHKLDYYLKEPKKKNPDAEAKKVLSMLKHIKEKQDRGVR